MTDESESQQFFVKFITYSVKRRETADDEEKKELHREKESVREMSRVIHVTRAPKDKREGDKEVISSHRYISRFVLGHF